MQQPRSITGSMIITRADGTKENLGNVLLWHRNPIVMSWIKIKRFLQLLKGK